MPIPETVGRLPASLGKSYACLVRLVSIYKAQCANTGPANCQTARPALKCGASRLFVDGTVVPE